MRRLTLIIGKKMMAVAATVLMTTAMISCGGSSETKQAPGVSAPQKSAPATEAVADDGKGVGPVKNLELAAEIDQQLALEGQEIFESMCSACHKIDKRYIGPAIKGVTDRRKPEWIMNMILNPNEMVMKDPQAKQLLAEFSAPMADQNLTEDQARKVLEYFRTLK
jgi:cytochrome c